MPRTSWLARTWPWLGAGLVLVGASCSGDKPPKRHAAPNEGVLPTAGKSSQNDDGAGNTGNEPSAVAAGAGGTDGTGSAEDAAGAGGAEPASRGFGTELRIDVAADTSTFVSLADAKVVTLTSDASRQSTDWDLAFRGWDIFTNGGASGGGKGAAFGPLPFAYFTAAEDPADVPFLVEDKAAGAFRDWYFYDGQWHTLYSRFHTYGVKSGERWFKVQLLGYYGDVQGAPISALYHLRYAEVTPSSKGDIVDVAQLDATAGGLGGDDLAASGCLSLRSGQQQQLTPSQAGGSRLWDLRFRRDSLSINGGLGGPGDVTALDLAAGETEGETLDAIKLRTADNQASAFAAVDYAALTLQSAKYRGDRIVSAFSDAWVDPTQAPPTLADDSAWLVVDAAGKSRFLLAFTRLEGSTSQTPGSIVMRIVRVR